MKIHDLIFWIILMIITVDGASDFVIELVHGPQHKAEKKVDQPKVKSDELKSDW